MKKYKIHKRRKKKSAKLVLSIFAISTFFVSYGYSTLADTLKLTGTANVKIEMQNQQDVSDIYEPMVQSENYSSSIYTYENVSNWMQGDGTYIYEVKLNITNLDRDYSDGNLEISFDEKQGLAQNQSKENLGILQAEKVLITGNRITVLLTELNSQLKYGETISLNVYITYEKEQKDGITIENVSLNGNKLGKEEPKVEIEDNKAKEESNKVENKDIEEIENNKIDNLEQKQEEKVVKEEIKTNDINNDDKEKIDNITSIEKLEINNKGKMDNVESIEELE